MEKLKLAIIGCGTVTEIVHLPSVMQSNRFNIVYLIDKDMERTKGLAQKYEIPHIAINYQQIFDKEVDAAIVALPNHLHTPVTIDLLQHGIHVLVEKPMALESSECDEMIAVANERESVLAVGMVRRLYNSSQLVKQVLNCGLLGNIVSFDFREGSISKWATVSDYVVRKEKAGGGVLTNNGIHVLDLLLWWLGDYKSVKYYDDAVGGVEADCTVYMHMKSGVSGIVELSRTRDLRNTCVIQGESGILEVGSHFDSSISLKLKNKDSMIDWQLRQVDSSDKKIVDVFTRQIDDFADSVLNKREPFVPGSEGKRSIELIEWCYNVREFLDFPWMITKEPRSKELA
ncbi:putative UDP-kanosamine synthase oxidoreductase subunit [bacterium BMS3Abin07]|nr:putative UDP-kanosamine synthase oxidoreductase subunit [bacterium BMS3Abin07]